MAWRPEAQGSGGGGRACTVGLQVASQEGGDKAGPFRRKQGQAGETRLG